MTTTNPSSSILHYLYTRLFNKFFCPKLPFSQPITCLIFLLILFCMSVLASQLERRFITTSMYKRSKNYFDISRLNQIEQRQQQSRRKPFLEAGFTDNVDSKLEESFVSAQARLNERLQTEFAKHQKRFFHEDCDETETNATSEGRKGKTLDMSKMLAREYFDREGNDCRNESHFCNFQQYRPPSNHKVDFRKFYVPKHPPRAEGTLDCRRCRAKLKSAAESRPAELNGDVTGKIHERLIFDESLFKATVDYKHNNREVSERSASPSPQKNYDLVLQGEELTRKQPQRAAQEFYHGMNKWNSAQMDNRLLKQNEYFLKAYNVKSEKQVDWAIVKRKSDLVDKRRREILMRKRIKDVKGEICDALYFRRNH